jgi:hypothetical protein
MKQKLQESVKFFQRKTKLRNCLLAVVFFAAGFTQSNAQTYPFTLPATVTATYNVTTSGGENFKTALLGYNIYSFTKTQDQDLIKALNSPVIRFPVGAPADWYKWETDGFSRFGDLSYNIDPFTSLINSYESSGHTEGIAGLTTLNNDKKVASGTGYDVLWIYNVTYNTPANSVSRLNDNISRGFNVKDIELGNETFYISSRGTPTKTSELLRDKTKAVAVALKAAKPSLRLGVPLSFKSHLLHHDSIMVADDSYFDAVIAHKYVGGTAQWDDALAARLLLKADVDVMHGFAPNKPIWLTEWGITSASECTAADALGMADCYIYMSENQDIYDRANWFSANGTANSFITFDSNNNNSERKVKFPFEITGFGQVHKVIRSVFEGSKMLDGIMTTSKLNLNGSQTNAVSARAVTKNGITTVLVVNLTNKSVPFTLKFNGTNYTGSFKHDALKFTSLSDSPNIPLTADPLTLVKNGSGVITLPPLSVSKISNLTIAVSDPVVHMQKANSTGFAIDGGNGGANNQPVVLWANSTTNANQQWDEIDRGGGYYSYLKQNTNYCIDGGNGGANNQLVKLYTYDSANQNQQWKKISVGSNKFVLEKRNAVGFSIDGGNGGANGTQLQLYTTNITNGNQQWLFSNGSGQLMSKPSSIVTELNKADLTSDAISIYPNPATTEITINGIDDHNSSVNIYNSAGEMVGSYSNSKVIAVSDLPAGIYMLKIKSKEISKSLKFIKEN